MMLIRAVLFLFLTLPAFAQSYLPEPTVAAAQTRSAAQCLGCDGSFTKYWWPIIALANPDGSGNLAYIQIATNGDPCFGQAILAGCGITKAHPGATATATLTAPEITSLLMAATISPTFTQTGATLAHENTAFSLTVTPFTDPRGETITYTATGMPAWMSFDPVAIKFSGTVPGSTALLTLHIIGTDQSGFSASEGIGVSITP